MTKNKEFTYRWNISDLKNVKKNNLNVFSCFACGGGSTMGYKMAGYNVIGCNEIDSEMISVYKKNHKPRLPFHESIETFKLRDDLPEELFNLDILDGSPPCSSFSMSGNREKDWGKKKKFREGQADQVLDDLFFHYIELARKLQPKVIVAENVKGMLMGNAKGYVKEIIKLFKDTGYNVQLFLLNGATMGLPQKRERVFFVCKRNDLDFKKLDLSFSERPIFFKEIEEIGAVAKSVTKHQMKYWNVTQPGESFSKYHPKGHFFGSSKVHPRKPLNTIIGSGGTTAYHYSIPRELSKMELCLGGSYPLDYDFMGRNVKYMVGMSVPPLMMYKISREIDRQWFNRKK